MDSNRVHIRHLWQKICTAIEHEVFLQSVTSSRSISSERGLKSETLLHSGEEIEQYFHITRCQRRLHRKKSIALQEMTSKTLAAVNLWNLERLHLLCGLKGLVLHKQSQAFSKGKLHRIFSNTWLHGSMDESPAFCWGEESHEALVRIGGRRLSGYRCTSREEMLLRMPNKADQINLCYTVKLTGFLRRPATVLVPPAIY